MIGINWLKIWKVAKPICKIVASGVLVSVLQKLSSNIVGDGDREFADYGTAIRVITRSNMFESDKQEVISMVRRDGDINYYRAVIAIAESNMFSSTKIETIRKLSEQW